MVDFADRDQYARHVCCDPGFFLCPVRRPSSATSRHAEGQQGYRAGGARLSDARVGPNWRQCLSKMGRCQIHELRCVNTCCCRSKVSSGMPPSGRRHGIMRATDVLIGAKRAMMCDVHDSGAHVLIVEYDPFAPRSRAWRDSRCPPSDRYLHLINWNLHRHHYGPHEEDFEHWTLRHGWVGWTGSHKRRQHHVSSGSSVFLPWCDCVALRVNFSLFYGCTTSHLFL